MRHLLPLALVGSLSLPGAALAQDPPAQPPAATGTVPNSASGSASGGAQESTSTAETPPKAVKRPKARKAKKKRAVVKGPVANFPSFRVLPDGSSRINLEVSEKVIVAERKAEGRLAYRLKNTQVPVQTNLLPLETSFFRTPVGRLMLVEVDDDIELVVELRQPSEATHRIVETDQGMILQVDFPAPPSQGQAPKPASAK